MTEPSAEVLRTIRSRRVARALTAQPVTRDQLDTVLEAASFAPSAGNRRLHPLVVVTDPGRLSVLRLVSPGMLQRPAAAIVICIDQANARRFGFRPGTPRPVRGRGHPRGNNPAGRARYRTWLRTGYLVQPRCRNARTGPARRVGAPAHRVPRASRRPSARRSARRAAPRRAGPHLVAIAAEARCRQDTNLPVVCLAVSGDVRLQTERPAVHPRRRATSAPSPTEWRTR